MAQKKTTKRKTTKKSTSVPKKVVKEVAKVVEQTPVVAKSLWQKIVDWVKSWL